MSNHKKYNCRHIVHLLIPKIIRLLTWKCFLKVPDQQGIWYNNHNFSSNEDVYFTFPKDGCLWVKLLKYHMWARVQAIPEFRQWDKKTQAQK